MKKVFIIAGEASGDIIGGNLVQSIKTLSNDFNFVGVGGEKMQDAGVEIIFHYEKIAVMGLIEVLFSYLSLKEYLKLTIEKIIQYKPDIIITIDSPGFNFRIIKALRKVINFKAIHYVAPTVWAYAENRVETVAKLYDHILLILPFESQYFQKMPHTFVGHSIIEDSTCLLFHEESKNLLKSDSEKLNEGNWIITILPGSRKGEIKRHIKILMEFISKLKQCYRNEKNIQFYFLTLPHLEDYLKNEIQNYNEEVFIISDVSQHNELIQKSVLGVVKSGTVTMRFMANCTPAITFYKVSHVTACIMKVRLKIFKINLCNIITNSNTLPELIQNDFTVANLLKNSIDILFNKLLRSKIINCYLNTWYSLKQKDFPSFKAAKIITENYEKN